MSQARKMTKEEFVEKVSQRNLSADDALNKPAEELYQYEKKYKMRSEVFFKIIVVKTSPIFPIIFTIPKEGFVISLAGSKIF